MNRFSTAWATLQGAACSISAAAPAISFARLRRGGRVTGIDFAPTMIEIARSKVAGADFQVGDAEALQFPNQSFDVALCSFGLWHMSEPDMALEEATRVLKTDGVYAYTTWLPPQQGWDMFDLLMKAVQAHGTVAVEGQMRVRRCSSD